MTDDVMTLPTIYLVTTRISTLSIYYSYNLLDEILKSISKQYWSHVGVPSLNILDLLPEVIEQSDSLCCNEWHA